MAGMVSCETGKLLHFVLQDLRGRGNPCRSRRGRVCLGAGPRLAATCLEGLFNEGLLHSSSSKPRRLAHKSLGRGSWNRGSSGGVRSSLYTGALPAITCYRRYQSTINTTTSGGHDKKDRDASKASTSAATTAQGAPGAVSSLGVLEKEAVSAGVAASGAAASAAPQNSNGLDGFFPLHLYFHIAHCFH